MRLAVLSDIHVLGPGETVRAREIARQLGTAHSWWGRRWHRALFRARRRFWNWHPHARRRCFLRALDDIARFEPDWVIANGDYGGDALGVGLSDAHTFESVAGALDLVRATFPSRARFVFGDHELGKYSTELRRGGIRLASLTRGEEQLGIRSFWHEVDGRFHLIGVNSTLFTLDLFLPEALPAEVPAWKAFRERHLADVASTFRDLPADARVLLFCHDPGALSALYRVDAVRARLAQVEGTILGHLHAPRLLRLTRLLGRLPKVRARYPVARIISAGSRDAHTWARFRPLVCPSTFGAGHHVGGGVLLLSTEGDGPLVVRRHRIVC
jgi:hypothetical protein